MSKKTILRVNNLSTYFRSENNIIKAVDNISFNVEKGEFFAIVGESGSGKSVSALSILKLLPYPIASHPSGEIFLDGEEILSLPEKSICHIRGKRISMIFQEPMTSLNPLHNIGKQISESLHLHSSLNKKEIKERLVKLLEMVGLSDLTNRLNAYPHELSGGQRQRVMIAMALANKPDILIADEPTTALDVTVQAQILKLLRDIQKKYNMSIILITHDLTIVKEFSDHVGIMHKGKMIEVGKTKEIFNNPKSEYTKHLLGSAPKGNPVKTDKNSNILLKANNIKVHFPASKNFIGKTKTWVKAVDGISLEIKEGHSLGVVGESGSGKSTLAMALLRLIPSKGIITYNGKSINNLKFKDIRNLRKELQFVFQDPFSSMNPRLTIHQIIREGLIAHNIGLKDGYSSMIAQSLKNVGLPTEIQSRYPHEFSGGQRQRICIARSLILKPRFMVLDEPTSALDLSTQKEILDLLKNLQKKFKLTYLFISHDLRVVKSICHDIIVMKDGKIVESGSSYKIFNNPSADYTKSLLKSSLNII